MKTKDLFALAIRLLGLVFLYHGLRNLPPAIVQILGSFPQDLGQGIRAHGSFGKFIGGIVMVAWPLLVAGWLLRGASFIMRMAYPTGTANAKETPQVDPPHAAQD